MPNIDEFNHFSTIQYKILYEQNIVLKSHICEDII